MRNIEEKINSGCDPNDEPTGFYGIMIMVTVFATAVMTISIVAIKGFIDWLL
jgi:hypothetical protein